MRIVTVRRITQVFFFLLFIWFCLVTTIGVKWWQLRGWPVNWLLELDPLVGLATLLIYVPPAAAQQRESAAKEATPWTRPSWDGASCPRGSSRSARTCC